VSSRLVKNGWLVAHKSSKQEIANLLGIVARDSHHYRVIQSLELTVGKTPSSLEPSTHSVKREMWAVTTSAEEFLIAKWKR